MALQRDKRFKIDKICQVCGSTSNVHRWGYHTLESPKTLVWLDHCFNCNGNELDGSEATKGFAMKLALEERNK